MLKIKISYTAPKITISNDGTYVAQDIDSLAEAVIVVNEIKKKFDVKKEKCTNSGKYGKIYIQFSEMDLPGSAITGNIKDIDDR